MPDRDLVSQIMLYECGELSRDGMVALFQELIDSGQAWKLQGHYGRVATALIQQGYCHPAAGEPDPVSGCAHVWSGDDTCIHCGEPKFP